MATPEELKELEKGLMKCFGDECKALQDQVDALKSQLKAEEEKEIPIEWKDYTKKCMGDECKKLKEDIIKEEREYQKQWHIDLQQQAEEEPPEEEPELDICYECSRNLPQGQWAEMGKDGCTHGN